MYHISDDKDLIDISAVHKFLSEHAYWARGRAFETVRVSIQNSYCLAAYTDTGSLAAFGRIVTDWATTYYVCDLFVLPPHRGNGLGKRLVDRIVNHPDLQALSGMLLTADAHDLYSRFGFTQDQESKGRFMIRRRTTTQQEFSAHQALDSENG